MRRAVSILREAGVFVALLFFSVGCLLYSASRVLRYLDVDRLYYSGTFGDDLGEIEVKADQARQPLAFRLHDLGDVSRLATCGLGENCLA